jgi:hypothetical protein
MFGYLYNFTTIIDSLTLLNVDITGNKYVGIIGFTSGGSQVKNIYASGDISSSNDYIGGIVGWLEAGSTIYNSKSDVNVTGNTYIGGIAGQSYMATIENTSSHGNVLGQGTRVGGLVGINAKRSVIRNCYSTANVSGSASVGGLVGMHTSDDALHSKIINSYSEGSVTAINVAGGLVGSITASDIINSYSISYVNCSGSSTGGLIASGSVAVLTSSFWDTQTSGQTISIGGTGKTTLEMQDLCMYLNAGWDFKNESTNGNSDIWVMNSSENNGYPTLYWENYVHTETCCNFIHHNQDNITACDYYTVPSGDETYNSSGVYNDTIPNTCGVDSIITIDLTINYSNTGDTTSQFEWARSAGSADDELSYRIVVDNEGNSINTGYFKNTVDFDPGTGVFNLTSNGDRDVYIQKLDSAGQLIWAKSVGSTGLDYGYNIMTDDNNNVYAVGYFHNTIDLNPNSGMQNATSNGNGDAFIIKLAPNGDFVWAKTIGGPSHDIFHAIRIDNNGDIVIAGKYALTTDFDPGTGVFNLTSQNSTYDIFVLKLSNSGDFIWAKSMGSTSGTDSPAFNLAIDASNNIILTGEFVGTANFNPTGTFNLTSNGDRDVFVVKLDENGDFIWAESFGGTGEDIGRGIEADNYNNIYVAGYYSGTVDMDAGSSVENHTSNGLRDMFVNKLDVNGNLIWSKTFGGSGDDLLYSLRLDDNNNAYSCGYYTGTVDFDPNTSVYNCSNNGGVDMYVQKLNPNGDLIWVETIGGTDNDVAIGVDITNKNEVYVSGYFKAIVDFDSSDSTMELSSNGDMDIFILKLSFDNSSDTTAVACNSFDWYGSSYTTSGDYTHTLSNMNGCDSVVTLHLTVNYSNTGDTAAVACDSFDWYGNNYTTSGDYTHTLTNINGCDSVVTLDLTINYSNTGTDVITACDTYTWIDGNTYTSSNNSATHTLTNANGCDSVVTLDLTMNYSNAGTDVITACDTYTWIDGNTYTSSNNTATHTLTNINGCDSVVTLDLTINYSNAGTDVITACDTYTWIDGNTYTSSNNTATHTLTNANGCDSVVTLDLTINYSNAGTDVITACDTYTWIDGNTYTSSNNSATHTLTNVNGCDSVVTLDLTINYSNAGTDVITACDTYTWIDGNTYTSSNNSATHTLTNVNGCDSVVTLDLTINYSNAGTDVITACDTYTWIDGNTYTSSNNSATHTLTNVNGCDSVVTLDLTINYSNAGTDVITACDTYTWIDGNTYTSSNNTATHTLTNINGCDSVVTLDLTINYSNAGDTTAVACDSFDWYGTNYTTSGDYAHTLTNVNGCDSVVTLHLTIATVDLTVIDSANTLSAITSGATYQWLDCNNNFNEIQGETNQSYTAIQNGSYAVIINNGICSDTSECINITNVALYNSIQNTGIELYPNPANDFVLVKSEKQTMETIEVIDITGKTLKEFKIQDSEFKIQIEDLPRGIYTLKVLTQNGITIKTFIKN